MFCMVFSCCHDTHTHTHTHMHTHTLTQNKIFGELSASMHRFISAHTHIVSGDGDDITLVASAIGHVSFGAEPR